LAKTNSAAAAGDSGFGGVEIGRARRRSAAAEEAGFGAAERALEAVSASEPAAPGAKNRPVRILWKPVPEYSEEGIRRRIEGDVVLLVRFHAQGTVETLKVVSGLGYGLDECALQAAESIRFEPATEGDRAVDSTAQVRIRFELAY
jgi:TonB family protein